jgi:CubicO group peptidase (beta-lactamase class C family)
LFVTLEATDMDRIRPAMHSYIDEGKIAGIGTLVIHHGEVIHSECYGMLDLEAGKPVQPDSIFRIYSLTKPITSVALMMLIEEGHLALEDPISAYIPELRDMKVHLSAADAEASPVEAERDITIWHLLTHTSGLGYGFGAYDDPVEDIYREAEILNEIFTLQTSLPEMVRRLEGLPLANQPGAAWRYGLAHDVIGYLIQLISGQPFDVFLKERIFEPLDMLDTGFYVPEGKLDRFGPMYSGPEEGEISVIDKNDDSPFLDPGVAPSGGTGLVSTMSDFSHFLDMLASGGRRGNVRLLAQDTVEQMTTNQLTGEQFPVRFDDPWPGMGYGLGVGVQTDHVPKEGWPAGVFGWIGISGTIAWVFPKESISVIAMPQARFYFDPADDFKRLVYETIIG